MHIQEIKLEKEMYAQARQMGLGFSEFLETLDPSSDYQGELGKLTAYERQLARLNIPVV